MHFKETYKMPWTVIFYETFDKTSMTEKYFELLKVEFGNCLKPFNIVKVVLLKVLYTYIQKSVLRDVMKKIKHIKSVRNSYFS